MPVLKNREQLSIKLHEMIKIPIVETNIKPGVRCPYIGTEVFKRGRARKYSQTKAKSCGW